MRSWSNPGIGEIRALLERTRTIAVVGLSDDPARPSHRVCTYLQAMGYTIIPVNPMIQTSLGQPARASLDEVPGPLDMVCVFRRGEEVPPIARAAVRLGARSLWMQDRVVSQEAAWLARDAGLEVVMDDCLLRRHQALLGSARE